LIGTPMKTGRTVKGDNKFTGSPRKMFDNAEFAVD
jgi:hypothetical protein